MGLFEFLKSKKTEKEDTPNNELVANEPQIQFVSLLFETKPILDKGRILEELKLLFENVDTTNEDDSLMFFFPDYTLQLTDATVPAQGVIIEVNKDLEISRFHSAFMQSWHWSEAEEVVGKCKFEINLTDLMSRTLPHQARLEYFQKFIRAVVKATTPAAIYFKGSDKLLAANDYLSALSDTHPAILEGVLNIRMFNISGSKNEILMDSIGLHIYGLPDFECIFSGYDPGEIAEVLMQIAYYIFDTGDTIRSNTTVQGVGKNPVWKTQYAQATVEPLRLGVRILPN